jgi:hypothetical protein
MRVPFDFTAVEGANFIQGFDTSYHIWYQMAITIPDISFQMQISETTEDKRPED